MSIWASKTFSIESATYEVVDFLITHFKSFCLHGTLNSSK